MELLSLDLIGWLYSLGSCLALAFGVVIIALHYGRRELRQNLHKWVLEAALFASGS